MLRTFFIFVRRLFHDFRRNQGLLLAGAVAYNTLLSLIPLFAVLLVALSHVVDQTLLIHTVAINLEFLVPGQAPAVTAQVAAFLDHRAVVGGVGLGALLFFSSMAFSILENAMAMIFHHRVPVRRRHAAISAVIPYVFVMALGVGLLVVAIVTGQLEAVGRASVHVLGRAWSLAGVSRTLLHLIGLTGSVLMLTAVYMVLPVQRVTFKRASIGAVAATALWEVVRHLLVWYFEKLSLVGVVYGSLATTVIVLLTLEVGALILLIGAQVIAELDRLADKKADDAKRSAVTASTPP